jgi:hypothetical protein
MVYQFCLYVHSWMRWVVILLCLLVFVRSLIGYIGRKPYLPSDHKLLMALLGSTHLQFFLGLLLYFVLSPITQIGLEHFPSSLKQPRMRFWIAEHFTLMILFVLCVQLSRTYTKKPYLIPFQKHKRIALFLGMGLILLGLGLPWPQKQGRPLFRLSQIHLFSSQEPFSFLKSYAKTFLLP